MFLIDSFFLIYYLQLNGLITSKKKFVGCKNWKARDKNHRFLTVPNNIDLELLETMFNENSYHSHNNDFEVKFNFYKYKSINKTI